MHTAAQLECLQGAAQGLLDGHPFESVRTQIEGIPTRKPDVWHDARDRKVPVAAALGHVCGMGAIQIVQSGDLPFQIPPDASPYTQYAALTAGIDHVAGRAAIAHIDDTGPSLAAAFDYYAQQIDILRVFENANPMFVTRRGKVPNRIKATAGDIVIMQQTSNALHNTPFIIFREAVRICHEEGAVPESEELARKLTARVEQLAHMTSVPGQVLFRLFYGDELAKRRNAALQTGKPLELPQLHHIMRQQAETGELHPLAPHLIEPVVTQTLEEEVAKIEAIKKHGNCAAQFALKPYEKPEAPGANRAQAEAYFASRGVALTSGAFKLVTYQLVRGIEVGQQTIFADPRARAALLTLARCANT